jgi:hypothetical protein
MYFIYFQRLAESADVEYCSMQIIEKHLGGILKAAGVDNTGSLFEYSVTLWVGSEGR